jgi:hypothetical protein
MVEHYSIDNLGKEDQESSDNNEEEVDRFSCSTVMY